MEDPAEYMQFQPPMKALTKFRSTKLVIHSGPSLTSIGRVIPGKRPIRHKTQIPIPSVGITGSMITGLVSMLFPKTAHGSGRIRIAK